MFLGCVWGDWNFYIVVYMLVGFINILLICLSKIAVAANVSVDIFIILLNMLAVVSYFANPSFKKPVLLEIPDLLENYTSLWNNL